MPIPPGVDTGGRLRVAGPGGARPGRGAASPGDLHLEIRVRPDPVLSRNGADIEMDLPARVAEAVLGTKVEVPTLEGPVHCHRPARDLERRQAAAARARGQDGRMARAAIRSCRVEIVVPKLAEDDAESRRLFEELGQRTQNRRSETFERHETAPTADAPARSPTAHGPSSGEPRPAAGICACGSVSSRLT